MLPIISNHNLRNDFTTRNLMKTLYKTFIKISLITISSSVLAFDSLDEHQGACLQCHGNNHDADFYEARSEGKLKSYKDLKGQINRCSNFYSSAWFPEEEAEIVSYLNNEYYGFKYPLIKKSKMIDLN